jgi:hypothetical protein
MKKIKPCGKPYYYGRFLNRNTKEVAYFKFKNKETLDKIPKNNRFEKENIIFQVDGISGICDGLFQNIDYNYIILEDINFTEEEYKKYFK